MKLLGFDIETYKELFCLVGIVYDTDTKSEVHRFTVRADDFVKREHMDVIEKEFGEADYIISFNGKRFDLPVVAGVRSDLNRANKVPVKYVYSDAMDLITYDEHNNRKAKRFCYVRAWNKKHFDLLNNCLLRHSLKQWEMFEGMRIRELPYKPDAELTEEMKNEICDYCTYDVWAMMELFWKYGFDHAVAGKTTLLAQKELVGMVADEDDRIMQTTAQALAASVIYGSSKVCVPPKTNQPLELFDIEEFNVPDEVKFIIAYLAKNRDVNYETTFKGIVYGKGGAHYIKPGHYRDVYAFDFASLYPSLIVQHSLLKTAEANRIYKEKRDYRVNVTKHNKELKNLDIGLKLFLNAPTGGFRMRSAYASAMYDPAVGEAMCYLGQLAISEVAFACPEFGNLLEVNTDSVFVKGEQNIAACRDMITKMKKHGLDLEEEYIPQIYVRDVNNYIMYDADGNVTGGKGIAYSDMVNKHSNVAMYRNLFDSLVKEKVCDLKWDLLNWKDYVVKYHKSSASKYATIDGETMQHKNYYFMWIKDCDDAKTIAFSRDVIDRKTGAIKVRRGVWSHNMEDLRVYAELIDVEQYRRDMDVELTLWGREDLVTTHLSKVQRKAIRTMGDVLKQELI